MASQGHSAKGEARRALIIESALDLFGRRGYHATTVRAVAEHCGLSHQALMYYFPTKEGLLEAVLRQRDERLSSHFDDPAGLDPRELITLAQVNRDKPGHVEMFSHAAADATDADHPAHQYYQEFYVSLVDALTRHIEGEFQRGERRRHPDLAAQQVAQAILGLQDGLQLQWLYDRDQDVAASMVAVLDTLAPPSPAGDT